MRESAIPRSKEYRRKKTPTVIQMEATECGAAALTIILGYYGSFIPLEEVRTMCSVTRDGSNALRMLKAAEYYGLKGEGFSAEIKDLYDAPLPLIAFWNFDHYVVIEGFSKDGVFINDPEGGPKKISYEEFNGSFTGVILTFSPTEKFQKTSKEKEKTWRALLWNRFHLFKAPFFFSVWIGLLSIIPLLALTVLSQVFIDNVLIGKLQSWSAGILIGFAFIVVLMSAMSMVQQWIINRFTIKLSTLLSSQFVWHTLRLPIPFFLQRYGGEIASRIELNEEVAQSWIGALLPAIINIVFAFVFAVVMLFYDVTITFIGIAIVLLNLGLMACLYRSREDAYANYRQIEGKLTSFTINGLESVESIKAVGGEYQFISRYGGLYAKSLSTIQNMASADLILGTLSPFLSILGSLAVLVLGALRIIEGQMTVGEFVALQLLYSNFTNPALDLINLNQTLQLLRINLLRLDDVLRHPQDPSLEVEKNSTISSLDRLRGDIEVKNLSFAYGPLDSPLLNNIDLEIPAGSTVALVGPTGCGKSTLVKIIGGLLNPRSGEVLFDGISSKQYPREVLTRSIGVVQQTPYLFEDTIEQNIGLMEFMPNENEMIHAAKDACIHEAIIERPGGYQAILEREGGNFSGGQRQRLEIASVLNRNPSILILDEATSAVDSMTERTILENVRKRGQTCLMITHRLKTIRNCDMILVMEDGEIVERGTHEELIGQSGLYQSLVESAEVLEPCGEEV